MADDNPRVRLRDLAGQLGLSIGTVSRALQEHPGLKDETKRRVLALAASSGYRPNLAARYLSSRKSLRISLNTPREIAYFYDAVRRGIHDEAAPFLLTGIELQERIFPRLGDGEKAAFDDALAAGVDGIVIVPGDLEALRPSFKRAARLGIPVVCVVTDAPDSRKLTSISVNTASSASLAAELLGRFLGGEGEAAITTGDLRVADHSEKTAAFRETLKQMSPRIKLFPPIQNHESEEEAYATTRRFLRKHPEVRALYVSTGNGAPILKAVADAGLLGSIIVITTDIFRSLLPRMAGGDVVATLYERPYSQGRIAFRSLHQFLTERELPTPRIRLEPLVMMRSQMRMFEEAVRRTETSGNAASDDALISELIQFDRQQ